jgi:UPF0755 protein
MSLFNKYFNFIVGLVAIAAAAVVAIHFIHAYDRMMALAPEATVTIPEGSTIYDIDRLLAQNSVLPAGDFISATNADSATSSLEGKLFPDTYDFYVSSTATSVIQKFLDNFTAKTASLDVSEQNLIIASIVQKEVTSTADMAMVAGIIDKRLVMGIPLDIDATICYIKEEENPTSTAGCYPLTAADFAAKSPYNTYLYDGLPPTPISNPGLQAINAAENPATSSYLYYLSDPKTGETIYAKTLAQQNANRVKYLGE